MPKNHDIGRKGVKGSTGLFLIAGLGNPGTRYAATRHNAGFRVIDLWRRRLGVRLGDRRFISKHALVRFRNREVILLCPQTFMNRSGKSVRACADYYGLDTGNILVVHDDLDLPAGRIKIVRQGGPGGHRGVASVIEHLGSRQFPRIRIGIGRPRFGEDVENYVLSPFYADEKDVMERVFSTAVCACEVFVLEGEDSAMNRFNCQNTAEKEEKSSCRD